MRPVNRLDDNVSLKDSKPMHLHHTPQHNARVSNQHQKKSFNLNYDRLSQLDARSEESMQTDKPKQIKRRRSGLKLSNIDTQEIDEQANNGWEEMHKSILEGNMPIFGYPVLGYHNDNVTVRERQF